jgi:NOL1/NOP2/fmu family ribosome biogenesis protein/23S rRNA U2552 (ribose-2'-O)-methylase RlmE/FtsJ
MSAIAALDVRSGMYVADLCAAPGGKSTQLASLIGHEGFILSNEYVPKRAKILVSNFERMGIRSYVTTSLDTAEIAKLYEGVFDIVVADAPCSGEGMFRKDVPAVEEWSEENVLVCQERQREILDNAAALVKCGGHLLYSTCTYSLEENEMTVDSFLTSHPEFELVPVKEELYSVTSDGITFDGASTKNLNLCRRFYPHKARGEGQFAALMRKMCGDTQAFLFKDAAKAPTREEAVVIESFFRENLTQRPDGRIAKYGENLVLISHPLPIPPRSVFSAGVLIGEIKGKVLIPSHQFFSAYGNLFKRQENITDSAFIKKYLAGEEIDAKSVTGTGFVSVFWNGTAIGGGKLVGGKIKNHYPKGLRVR